MGNLLYFVPGKPMEHRKVLHQDNDTKGVVCRLWFYPIINKVHENNCEVGFSETIISSLIFYTKDFRVLLEFLPEDSIGSDFALKQFTRSHTTQKQERNMYCQKDSQKIVV